MTMSAECLAMSELEAVADAQATGLMHASPRLHAVYAKYRRHLKDTECADCRGRVEAFGIVARAAQSALDVVIQRRRARARERATGPAKRA